MADVCNDQQRIYFVGYYRHQPSRRTTSDNLIFACPLLNEIPSDKRYGASSELCFGQLNALKFEIVIFLMIAGYFWLHGG